MTPGRRIRYLESIYHTPPRDPGIPPLPELDFSALSPEEVGELDELLDGPAAHQRRYGVGSDAMLTPAQRARLRELAGLLKVKEPAAATSAAAIGRNEGGTHHGKC